MEAIALILGQLFKSKYFWYAVIALIVIVLIKKQWTNINAGLNRTFNKDKQYQTDENGNVIVVRESYAKDLASKLNIEMKSTTSYFNSDDDLYNEIYNLNDQDLEFMAKYYDVTLTRKGKGQMYKDIKNEFIIGDVDEAIMNRLSVLGLGI